MWYCNVPIGAKKLGVFMSELSEKCNLSRIYTNHSIRATGATLLSKHKYGFGDAQIISVTGHKCVQSLTTYQRIDTEDKIKMGKTLTDNLVPVSSSSNQVALPSTAMLALPSTSDVENIPPGVILQDLVPVNPRNRPVVLAEHSSDNTFMDELRDIDFSDILNEFNDNTAQVQIRQTNMQANPQIFYGNVTVIHNLTINK